MPKVWRFNIGLIAFTSLLSVQAQAQTPYLNLRDSNFDIWRQEYKNLPVQRGDQRTPKDEQAYKAYRDKNGDFEESLRLKRQKRSEVDKTFLHKDPIDNPQSP